MLAVQNPAKQTPCHQKESGNRVILVSSASKGSTNCAEIQQASRRVRFRMVSLRRWIKPKIVGRTESH